MSPVTVTSLSSYIILQVLNKNRGYIKQIIAPHSAKCKLFIANDYVHECNVIPIYHVCVQYFILYIKSFFLLTRFSTPCLIRLYFRKSSFSLFLALSLDCGGIICINNIYDNILIIYYYILYRLYIHI